MPFLAGVPAVQDYGAYGDGVHDDTAAILAAATAVNAAGGGPLFFPEGTYQVTPVSSTVAGIVLNTGTAGFQSVRFVGAGALSTKLRRTAPGPILSMSGPSTSTGTTHCKYCTLEHIRLDGNAFTGTMLQTYYADNLSFEDCYFGNCPDIVQDSAEFWDSRYYNCVWESSGSATANTAAPNVLLRNSAAASGFGNSANNTNQIHFLGCRWEGFSTGALTIAQGVSNSGTPQQIYLVNCKMETAVINGAGASGGGSHLSVDANSRSIYVDNLYIYSGGFYSGYSTALDAISWSAQDSTLSNVFISTSATQTVANGVTVNSATSGQWSVLRNVTGVYGGLPTGNHITYGTGTGGFVLDNCNSNQSAATQYAAEYLIVGQASSNNTFGSIVSGDSFKRWVSNANGAFTWGPGNAAGDTVLQRAAAGVLGTSKNFEIGGVSGLGDNGVGELQLANATTIPTTNPTGGGVGYATAGTQWWRDSAGVVSVGISPSEFSASPTGCLGETLPRIVVNSAAQAIGATTGTVYMTAIWLPAGLKITNLNFVTGTTAATSPTHWWLGLANSAGLQLAHCSDQTSAAIGASSLITKALTSAFTTTYTGTHYLLLSVTATTNPTASGIAAPTNMNVTSPLLAGVSTSAAQPTPGTDGTTTYVVPSAAGGVPYMYLT